MYQGAKGLWFQPVFHHRLLLVNSVPTVDPLHPKCDVLAILEQHKTPHHERTKLGKCWGFVGMGKSTPIKHLTKWVFIALVPSQGYHHFPYETHNYVLNCIYIYTHISIIRLCSVTFCRFGIFSVVWLWLFSLNGPHSSQHHEPSQEQDSVHRMTLDQARFQVYITSQWLGSLPFWYPEAPT